MGGIFDGALPDEVKEVKTFRIERVCDGDVNFAKDALTDTSRVNPTSTLGVGGRAAARGRSWTREN